MVFHVSNAWPKILPNVLGCYIPVVWWLRKICSTSGEVDAKIKPPTTHKVTPIALEEKQKHTGNIT